MALLPHRLLQPNSRITLRPIYFRSTYLYSALTIFRHLNRLLRANQSVIRANRHIYATTLRCLDRRYMILSGRNIAIPMNPVHPRVALIVRPSVRSCRYKHPVFPSVTASPSPDPREL